MITHSLSQFHFELCHNTRYLEPESRKFKGNSLACSIYMSEHLFHLGPSMDKPVFIKVHHIYCSNKHANYLNSHHLYCNNQEANIVHAGIYCLVDTMNMFFYRIHLYTIHQSHIDNFFNKLEGYQSRLECTFYLRNSGLFCNDIRHNTQIKQVLAHIFNQCIDKSVRIYHCIQFFYPCTHRHSKFIEIHTSHQLSTCDMERELESMDHVEEHCHLGYISQKHTFNQKGMHCKGSQSDRHNSWQCKVKGQIQADFSF